MPSRILRLWNPDVSAWEEVGDSRLSTHLAASDPHSQYVLETVVDAKGDLLAGSAADTLGRLAVGTTNQVLTADSAQTLGVKWADSFADPTTTKGDLLARASATADPYRLLAPPSKTLGTIQTADPNAYEFGYEFSCATARPVTALGWYRVNTTAPKPTGLRLWDTTNSTAVITITTGIVDSAAVGWQYTPTAGFTLVAGRHYRVSFSHPGGHYGADTNPTPDADITGYGTYYNITTVGTYPTTTHTAYFGSTIRLGNGTLAGLNRLPAGTDGQLLTADSTQALGVKWAAGASGTYLPLTGGTLSGSLTVNARGYMGGGSDGGWTYRNTGNFDIAITGLDNSNQFLYRLYAVNGARNIAWWDCAGTGAGGTYYSEHHLPRTTTTYDQGGTSNRWRKLYAQDADLSGTLTLGGDVTLQRTSAGALRVDTQLAVGAAPAAWSGVSAVQAGVGALWANTTINARLGVNTYWDGSAQRAITTGTSSYVQLDGNTLSYLAAPSVSAGATTTPVTRLAVSATGTLTVTPDSGGNALVAGGLGYQALTVGQGGATNVRLAAGSSSSLELSGPGGYVVPAFNNTTSFGATFALWTQICATAGTINTSSREAKTGITPLDPAVAMAAVRATTPCTFDYLTPTRPEGWYELPDDPEQGAAFLEQRLRAGPLEAGARHQAGVVLGDSTHPCDPLFQTGEGQTNAANSVGVLLAAIKQLDSRLTAVGG